MADMKVTMNVIVENLESILINKLKIIKRAEDTKNWGIATIKCKVYRIVFGIKGKTPTRENNMPSIITNIDNRFLLFLSSSSYRFLARNIKQNNKIIPAIIIPTLNIRPPNPGVAPKSLM
jgi:hypothetical protein